MEKRNTMDKMIKIIHRINRIEELNKVPREYGVEVDVRGKGDKMFLSHDPITLEGTYDELEEYLKQFNHTFIIFNVKEAGYEDRIIGLAKKYNIEDYFLLDVEFPYLYRATRTEKFRKIAVRYSEAEPIESVTTQVENEQTLLDWVWIDTITRLPIDKKTTETLRKFKTCLVCPSRWGRPEDIASYKGKINELGFELSAVMTSLDHIQDWEK